MFAMVSNPVTQVFAYLSPVKKGKGHHTDSHSNLVSSKSPQREGHYLYLYYAYFADRLCHSIILPSGIFSSQQNAKQ